MGNLWFLERPLEAVSKSKSVPLTLFFLYTFIWHIYIYMAGLIWHIKTKTGLNTSLQFQFIALSEITTL